MMSRGSWMACLGALALAGALRAGPVIHLPQASATDRDVTELAARIDYWIAMRWSAEHVKPAAVADDAEFVRRVSLDIAGRIPRVQDVRDFLANRSPEKRRRVVERLLAGRQYTTNFANIWLNLLVPEDNVFGRNASPALLSWLRQELRDNVPYNKMVRELITAPGTGQGDEGPGLYLAAQGYKPENLASSTSRLFLGVKLECAQCHNDKSGRWTQAQFWQYAAFFAGLENDSPRKKKLKPPELVIPSNKRVVSARFLDGKRPRWQPGADARRLLADWMTASKNPYFAGAAVNRLWAHFFGIGLAEPVDDLNSDNPPSHPELFDELCRQFVAHGYDTKFMIRAIIASRAYQCTSAVSEPGQDRPRLFAVMAVKGLTPEQLFESVAQATGYREDRARPNFFGLRQSPRSEFLAKFANHDKPTESQMSILQALSLMNGKFIADATSLHRSETLAAVLDAPFLDTPGRKIETLYLATLSRLPREAERARFVRYVERAGIKGEHRAVADVFWALLNSSEFVLNH